MNCHNSRQIGGTRSARPTLQPRWNSKTDRPWRRIEVRPAFAGRIEIRSAIVIGRRIGSNPGDGRLLFENSRFPATRRARTSCLHALMPPPRPLPAKTIRPRGPKGTVPVLSAGERNYPFYLCNIPPESTNRLTTLPPGATRIAAATSCDLQHPSRCNRISTLLHWCSEKFPR